jgi:hypothetical protein
MGCGHHGKKGWPKQGIPHTAIQMNLPVGAFGSDEGTVFCATFQALRPFLSIGAATTDFHHCCRA